MEGMDEQALEQNQHTTQCHILFSWYPHLKASISVSCQVPPADTPGLLSVLRPLLTLYS